MSVIVKGMEMPKTGWGCPLNSYGICTAKHEILDNCYEELPDWCPLRPLPEKHGDLIDRNALLSGEWERCDAEEAIRNAAAIVEAEGEPLKISGTAYFMNGTIYLDPDFDIGGEDA